MEDKPWMLLEGIYNPEEDTDMPEKDPHKVVFYSGDLGRRYGIIDLLKAFNDINDSNYRLWICGNGDGKEDVIYYSGLDKRIKYLGILPRKEVLLLQKSATLLVNPRHSNEEYTRFSFPSKTMEYMASGTPTLMAHLSCMPKDYDNHLFYLVDESVDGLRKEICRICELSGEMLLQKGNAARSFILNQKMPKQQVSRIINFLCQL